MLRGRWLRIEQSLHVQGKGDASAQHHRKERERVNEVELRDRTPVVLCRLEIDGAIQVTVFSLRAQSNVPGLSNVLAGIQFRQPAAFYFSKNSAQSARGCMRDFASESFKLTELTTLRVSHLDQIETLKLTKLTRVQAH